MKVRMILAVCLGFLFSALALATDSRAVFQHDIPQGIIQGENARFELMISERRTETFDVRMFYRELGGDKFISKRMKNDGYMFYAELNTTKFHTGNVEYYFAYEGALGEIGTLPGSDPEMNPFIMHISPERDAGMQAANGVEIIVLSPDPGELIAADEIMVSASILASESDIDFSRTALLIDGVNVTSLSSLEDGLLTFAPEQIRQGIHNIELKVYDNGGSLLDNKEWSFRTKGSLSGAGNSSVHGSFFVEDRSQNVGQRSDNYVRGGGYMNGKYNDLDYGLRLVVSSEEASDRQPVNRYAGHLKYNFDERNNVYLYGGDFSPYYNSLAFRDKRVRGVQAGLAYGIFTLDAVFGQTNRGVEGFLSTDSILTSGTYAENVMAIRPGFRFGESVHWNLNFVKSTEDENSITFGGNTREAVSVGTDLSMNFDKKRILVDASVQASINNSNAAGKEIEFADLVSLDSSLADNSQAENLFDLLKSSGLIAVTNGLNPLPSYGIQVDARFRYFKNNLKFSFSHIQKDFASPGNPYLLKDVSGFYAGDNIRLFDNQVYLNLYFKSFNYNMSEDETGTDNVEFGSSLSYYPAKNLPAITIGFANISRQNSVDAAKADTIPSLFVEDNSTQRLSLSSSYRFDVSGVRNVVSLTAFRYQRDEPVNKESQNDFSQYGIGIRNMYSFPMVSKISYSQSTTNFGSTIKSTTEISKIALGLEYMLNKVMGNDQLKPFLNVTLQTVDAGLVGSKISTSRNNYSAGLAYRNQDAGVFSLRFDQITYSTLDYNDSVLNARYEYHF